MVFRTPISPLAKMQGLIDHHSPVWLVGSCFSDNIGALMQAEGFNVRVNPLGTLYSPASIAHILGRLLDGYEYTPPEMLQRGEIYVSYDFHSRISSTSPQELSQRLNALLEECRRELTNVSTMIFTLGSTRYFRLRETSKPVANCHKQPSQLFEERRSTLTEVVEQMAAVISRLRAVNPEMRFIFTVSPIRHKEDMHADRLSKSTLLLAVEELTRQFENAIYFPAYEALVDDLRDYRFYASDMIHPSEVAVKYVYSLFADSFYTPATRRRAAEEYSKYLTQQHRPLTPHASDLQS